METLEEKQIDKQPERISMQSFASLESFQTQEQRW